MGLLGDLFDFNNDGKLDSFEKAAEFGAFMQMIESEEQDEEDDEETEQLNIADEEPSSAIVLKKSNQLKINFFHYKSAKIVAEICKV